MKIEELFEMPIDIDPLDWYELNDPEENRKEYIKRIGIFGNRYKYKKLILKFSDTAAIYKQGSEYFCLDKKLQRITYYMSYQVDRNKILGDYVWQSLVWAITSEHVEYLKDIPQKIFWEQLFSKFQTVITDSEQTWHGRRFWELRIAEAFRKKLKVYYFNFANKQLVQVFSSDELRDFQLKYDIWGKQPANALKRMLITSKELNETF